MKFDAQIECLVTPDLALAIGPKYGSIDTPHSHANEYQIEVPFFGTFQDLSRKNAKQFVPGTANVFNPGEPHRTHYEKSNSYFFFVSRKKMAETLDSMGCTGGAEIAFDPNRPYRIETPLDIQKTLSSHALQLHVQRQKALDDSLMQMITVENSQLFLNATLKSLVSQISWSSVTEKMGYHSSIVQRAQKWISDNLSDTALSLEKIAAAVRMSPFHFSRVFKERTGESPIAWLCRKRTERAIAIVIERRVPLEIAAIEAGFGSAKQLHYHLKRHPDLFEKLADRRNLIR